MKNWVLNLERAQLTAGETKVDITPKAAAVLVCLIEKFGNVVTRQKILDTVWPGLHVTPHLVREYIFDLRQALGDDAQAPEFIETVRGSGFRLKKEIGILRQDQNQFLLQTQRHSKQRTTLAVLAPSVSSGDEKIKNFADALSRDLILDLARQHDLAVVASSSSFAQNSPDGIKSTAASLGADYIIEMSISELDDLLRARFHLIDGQTAQHIWAHKFDQNNETEAEFSTNMLGQVLNALAGWQGEIHRAEFRKILSKQDENLTAQDHFVLGCDLELNLELSSLKKSLLHLEKSLELDPQFARCWVVKSLVLLWAYDANTEADYSMLVQSAEAIERGFLLDPVDPTTLAMIAIKRAREGQLELAVELTHKAAQLSEQDADACIASANSLAVICGEFDRATGLLSQALELNPTPPGWYRFIEARVNFYAGNYRASILAAQIAPRHLSSLIYLALSYAMEEETERARDVLRMIELEYPRFEFKSYGRNFPIADERAAAKFKAACGRLYSSKP